jgi:hypothetical protein
MNTEEEIVSNREFARRVGASEGSVRNAIKQNKIVDGLNDNGQLIYSKALVEWTNYYGTKQVVLKKQVAEKQKKLQYSIIPEDNKHLMVDPNNPDLILIDNDAKINEAKRVESIAKARTAQLEYEKLKGSLVSTKEVYNEFFAIGQVLRQSLQSIPEKYIDLVMACDTRAEALQILNKAVVDALEEFENSKKQIDL